MDPIAITPSAAVATQQPAPLQASAHYMPQVRQHFEQAYNTYQPIVNDIVQGKIEVQGMPEVQAGIGFGTHPPEQEQSGYSTGVSGRLHSGGYTPTTGQYDTGVPEPSGTWQGPLGPTHREYNGGQPITSDQMQQGNPGRYADTQSAQFNGYPQPPNSYDSVYPVTGGSYSDGSGYQPTQWTPGSSSPPPSYYVGGGGGDY